MIRTKGTRIVAEAVADVVREKHITQVIFGRSAVKGLHRLFYLSAVHRFLRRRPPWTFTSSRTRPTKTN